ncbi:SRPBCC family protein [Methylocystis sp. ATCC 49242]|uniref:SRPBCC family protein n=1 Tax=Methylocystis sp. ATCC 49242 TaxID=622637 RepID=UPI0001F86D07|nr:SRPBCC family protein [Methylocystis sp. ATCC 49242]
MLGLSLKVGKPAAVRGAATAVISRSIDSAYGFVVRDFFLNYQRWCPQVIELDPSGKAPVYPGVKARQVTLERGIRSESTFEIVDVEEPRRLTLEGRSEPFRSSYQFDATPTEDTRVTFEFEMCDLELSMRPFAKLIRATLQDGAEQTVENLKRILEGESQAADAT